MGLKSNPLDLSSFSALTLLVGLFVCFQCSRFKGWLQYAWLLLSSSITSFSLVVYWVLYHCCLWYSSVLSCVCLLLVRG